MISSTLNEKTARLLTRIHLFGDVEATVLESISPLFASKTFRRNQEIICYKEHSTDVYFITEGEVRTTMFSPRGREVSYQDLAMGDMFGEIAAIDQLPRSTHVIALSPVKVLVISGANFLSLLREYPMFAHATLLRVVALVRFLCDKVYEYGAMDVGSRVRAELLRLSKQSTIHDNRATLSQIPKHQELANRLATHREAITRELSYLEKTGIIRRKKGSLEILDIGRLEQLVDS